MRDSTSFLLPTTQQAPLCTSPPLLPYFHIPSFTHGGASALNARVDNHLLYPINAVGRVPPHCASRGMHGCSGVVRWTHWPNLKVQQHRYKHSDTLFLTIFYSSKKISLSWQPSVLASVRCGFRPAQIELIEGIRAIVDVGSARDLQIFGVHVA